MKSGKYATYAGTAALAQKSLVYGGEVALLEQMQTTRATERYLEAILSLAKEKGYARTGDIAKKLSIKSPSVSGMLDKLKEQGLVHYEKYSGAKLTCRGCELAKSIHLKRKIFAKFLQMLGVPEENIERDAAAMEGGLSPHAIAQISKFVELASSEKSAPKFMKGLLENKNGGQSGK